MPHSLLLPTLLLLAIATPGFAARKWTDATGKYVFEGDLIGVNDSTVVVQKTSKKKELVAIPIDQLSKADQAFLKTQEAATAAETGAGAEQTWTMRSGLKVVGRAVEYGRRDVTLQRRRAKIYVNDRLFENLNGVQQKLVFKVVSHFEKIAIDDKNDLEKWIVKLKAAPKTFTCDGVLLELDNGDVYGVPFFLFSDADLKVLQPGWDRWLAAHEAQEKKEQAQEQAQADKEREALLLKSQAEAYQREKEADRQHKLIELQLQAVDAGVTSAWEVELLPRGRGYSRTVVVFGRDSNAAAQAALSKNPGYTIGGISRAN